jgi:hypothetical protein
MKPTINTVTPLNEYLSLPFDDGTLLIIRVCESISHQVLLKIRRTISDSTKIVVIRITINISDILDPIGNNFSITNRGMINPTIPFNIISRKKILLNDKRSRFFLTTFMPTNIFAGVLSRRNR